MEQPQASYMFAQASQANSVASDLTEKIREFMKHKDGSYDQPESEE